MNFLILFLMQFILLLIAPILKAAVVVIPTKEQSFESYTSECTKENFACTYNIIKDKLVRSATPKYDQLITDMDLHSPLFMNDLNNRIKDLLESEMLSLDQLDSLINILQRTEEIAKNKELKLLRIELQQLHSVIQRSPEVENFKFIIFKKALGTLSKEKLRTLSFSPFFKEIDFQKEFIAGQPLAFKAESCSKSRLSDVGHLFFSDHSYKFSEEKDCSWTDSFSEAFKSGQTNESKYRLSAKEKNIILWSTVAIAAGLFLNQYEFIIEY